METFLSGKTVLITGGTSELGSVFVRKALSSGARVLFTYFKAVAKAKELEAAGAEGLKADLSKVADIKDLITNVQKREKILDVLIHNAAGFANGLIQDLSEADWDWVIAADLCAPLLLTQGLLPLLEKKKPGKILMIVSQAGVNGLYGAGNYAAAKGGMIDMTKILARELGEKKILVNAVNPGFMLSGMTRELPERVAESAKNRSPLKTLSNPEEVAGFLVYLCSGLVTQVTGQVFHFESRPL